MSRLLHHCPWFCWWSHWVFDIYIYRYNASPMFPLAGPFYPNQRTGICRSHKGTVQYQCPPSTVGTSNSLGFREKQSIKTPSPIRVRPSTEPRTSQAEPNDRCLALDHGEPGRPLSGSFGASERKTTQKDPKGLFGILDPTVREWLMDTNWHPFRL